MKTTVTFLVEHWVDILVYATILAAIVLMIVKFLKLTPKQQLSRIQTVLLSLVTEAERALGTKTGKVKRAAVYSAVVKKFPVLSVIISESTFDKLLDDTLKQFQELLETNDQLYEYVYNRPRGEEGTSTISSTVDSYKNMGSEAEAMESQISKWGDDDDDE